MYRAVETGFWDDPKVRGLPFEAKYLFLYLITNRHAHPSGIYYLPRLLIAHETGLSRTRVDTLLDTLSAPHLALADAEIDVVWVVKMKKYQARGKKHDISAANHLLTLHKSCLINDFLTEYPSVRPLYEHRVSDGVSAPHTPHPYRNQESGIRNQEEEDPPDLPSATADEAPGRVDPKGNGQSVFDKEQDRLGLLTTSECCEVWNEVAREFRLPSVRGPGKLKSKVQTFLKAGDGEEVVRSSFRLFASQDFIQQRRYSLGNFLPNAEKYLIQARDGVVAEDIPPDRRDGPVFA